MRHQLLVRFIDHDQRPGNDAHRHHDSSHIARCPAEPQDRRCARVAQGPGEVAVREGGRGGEGGECVMPAGEEVEPLVRQVGDRCSGDRGVGWEAGWEG
jgi:hypothetical protein